MTTVESVGLLAVSSPLSRVMLPGPGGGGGGWLLPPPPSLFLSTTAVTADNLTIWCCLFLFMTKLVILWDDYQHRIIIFNIQYLENKTFLWQSIIMPSLAIQCYDDYLTGSVDSRFWTKQDMQRSRRCVSVSPPAPPATEQHRIRTWAQSLWQKRAGVATQWSQPIGAQYLEGSLTCLSHVEPPGLHWSGFPSPHQAPAPPLQTRKFPAWRFWSIVFHNTMMYLWCRLSPL